MEHSIRFDIEDPARSMANGRKEAYGAGEHLGYQLGRLAKNLSYYLTDFDKNVIDGFCNGIDIFPEDQ